MFELSVACKYLMPRRRQLSVSIISLISVLVIALVVWLIVVFFSVTDGLEKNWIQKLTALTAPLRITPTDAYYHSYYYLVDSISDASQYSNKTIREKNASSLTDPYNPDIDEEIPAYWPLPDRYADGSLKDLVKLVYHSLDEMKHIPGLKGQDFELTATHIRLHLVRRIAMLRSNNLYGSTTQSSLSYPAYLGNFEQDNSHLNRTLLTIENEDLNNVLSLIGTTYDVSAEELQKDKTFFNQETLKRRLEHFFDFVTIQQLKAQSAGWAIPRHLLPKEGQWDVCVILKDQQVMRLIAPLRSQECFSLQKHLEEQGLTAIVGRVFIKDGILSLIVDSKEQPISPRATLTLAGNSSFLAKLDPQSLFKIRQIEDLLFDIEIPLQESLLKGKVTYRGLEIAKADLSQNTSKNSSFWTSSTISPQKELTFHLPQDPEIGEGIILPKSFRDAGVLIGDRGSLSYLATTTSLLQEQQIPVYVAGFYDPGIIPIGGKFILANPDVTSLIRASHQLDDKTATTNGINVRFQRIEQADEVKFQLLNAFKSKGINRYWNVETYREYEFTKEIMHELQSQKNLFMLIAIVIILVACSNIISMLIILVNDKKLEIGILRSMGASSQSIALIFGLSGALIGVTGSLIGIIAAILTLHYLDTLIYLLGRLQGHEMFNAGVYGHVLPSELSFEALSFVLIATMCISLLAGIVPAIKACLLKPSHILRTGGG